MGVAMGLGKLCLLLLLLCGVSLCKEYSTYKCLPLPDDWLFGASSAAPQVEGAWNEDGKGESAWDYYAHQHPENIHDGANADIAADFYHHYEEDIKRVSEMGMNTFRFSVAWTRIMPNGLTNSINKKGIQHYHKVLDACEKYNITAIVNIDYWDMPQHLIIIGGWTNPIIINYFLDFCDVVFREFGDKVKWWLTFNEPTQMTRGYDGNSSGHAFAPNIPWSGVAPYIVGHNALLAHAKAYYLYHDKYEPKQKGKISLIIETGWCEPKDPNKKSDQEAAIRARDFTMSWFLDPIFSKEGDYPKVMKERIERQSKKEGFYRSRLPKFTKEEIEYIKGSADFLAINHYTTYLVASGTQGPTPSVERDSGVILISPPEWPGSEAAPWLKIAPTGLRRTIKWLRDKYGNIPIIVTENGFIDGHEIEDVERCKYMGTYILETLKALYYDGVKVFGYLAWSLLDSFEWGSGYSSAAGLHHVDMRDPGRKRTPRMSAKLMSLIGHKRCVPPEYEKVSRELEEKEFPKSKHQ